MAAVEVPDFIDHESMVTQETAFLDWKTTRGTSCLVVHDAIHPEITVQSILNHFSSGNTSIDVVFFFEFKDWDC